MSPTSVRRLIPDPFVMQSLADIKGILESQGLRPNKSLGQNFLIEPAHVTRLVDAAALAPGDLVLEVGPGTGVLTDVLLEHGCRVVACELDRGLAAMLRQRYAHHAREQRFTLVEGDCLASKHELNPELLHALDARPFKLVANLPYGAASPLMIALATRFHPFRAPPAPSTSPPTPSDASRPVEHAPCLGQFVTIQREVAQRLRAAPNTRDFGEMGVLVQAMCEVQRLALLPPGCFWPAPKIDSEMVSIIPRARPLTNDPAALADLCRLLFTQRRKQLGAILRHDHPHLLTNLPAGVAPSARPESLSVAHLVELAGARRTSSEPAQRDQK